ncbi:hypothetical protein [Subtercola boreus]|nr:hypothetical protein [Subtercola boreus]
MALRAWSAVSGRVGAGIVAAAGGLFSLAVFAAVSEAQRRSVVLWLGWTGTTKLKAAAVAVVVVCGIVAVACFGFALNSRVPWRVLRLVGSVVLFGVLIVGGGAALLVTFVSAVVTGPTKYHAFSSPDGQTIVLITEDDWGHGQIAEQVWGPLYAVGTVYSADDYYLPVAAGTFSTAWTPTTFTLTYQTDADTPGIRTATIDLDR